MKKIFLGCSLAIINCYASTVIHRSKFAQARASIAPPPPEEMIMPPYDDPNFEGHEFYRIVNDVDMPGSSRESIPAPDLEILERPLPTGFFGDEDLMTTGIDGGYSD